MAMVLRVLWIQTRTGNTKNGHRTQNPELALPLTMLVLKTSLLSMLCPTESLWPLEASHCFLHSQRSQSTSLDFHDAHWKSPLSGVEKLTEQLCGSPLTQEKLCWLQPLYISIHCKNPQLPGVNRLIKNSHTAQKTLRKYSDMNSH